MEGEKPWNKSSLATRVTSSGGYDDEEITREGIDVEGKDNEDVELCDEPEQHRTGEVPPYVQSALSNTHAHVLRMSVNNTKMEHRTLA